MQIYDFSPTFLCEPIDFLKLAKKGKPQKIIAPAFGTSQKDFDIALQQSELIKSFDYLRKNCNLGLKS